MDLLHKLFVFASILNYLAHQTKSHPQCILQFRSETSHNANYVRRGFSVYWEITDENQYEKIDDF